MNCLKTLGFTIVLAFIAGVAKAEYIPPYCETLVDATSGKVLYSYNPYVKTQPASLTKMMTLYVVFKEIEKGRIKLSDRVSFSANAVKQRPSKLGLEQDASISVKEAIIALVVKSANDVAVALAEKVGGNSEDFVKLMNCYAKMLGMYNTNFCNPSGWKCCYQYTTASDMAKLGRALLINLRDFYSVFSVKNVKYCGAVIKNHNNILGELSDGIIVDGIKTGYVAASGYNLVASAKKSNKRLIAVVLGSTSASRRDKRIKYLISCGFKGELPETPPAFSKSSLSGKKIKSSLRSKHGKRKTIKTK